MAALENSVRAARESRGEEPAEDAEVKRLPTQDVPLVPEGHGRQEVDVDGEEEDDVVASEVDVEDVAGREEEHDEEDGGEEDPGEEDNVPQTLGLIRLRVVCLRRGVLAGEGCGRMPAAQGCGSVGAGVAPGVGWWCGVAAGVDVLGLARVRTCM